MSVCTPKSFDLTGKVALITGASYGIGFAIATAMANCGATIVFNDIKQELVDKGLAAYKEAGITAHGYVCDVTNEDAVNAMVKQITEEVGHINILVNNAGIIKRIPMCEMTAALCRWQGAAGAGYSTGGAAAGPGGGLDRDSAAGGAF